MIILTALPKNKKINKKNNVPNRVVNATYCNFCRWIGISLAMSWWIIGKNGGQFFSSRTIPAAKQNVSTYYNN